MTNPDLIEAAKAIIAEVSAVDACGEAWTPADQLRYVRLVGIDEMARADDAQYDYMADCVMLAGQNLQDARLQLVEERLQALERPAPPTIGEVVIDTAIMLGLELCVLGGLQVAMAEVAAQALIGPRKYIQGRGVLGSLGEHVNDLGKT